MHRAAVLLFLSPLLARDKASEYPAHTTLPGMEIGAEYLLHSILTEKGSYVARDYLVVDVGVFPSTIESIKLSSGQFTLRINHGKTVLKTDSPGTVAASIKYPDWEQHPVLTAQAGPVIAGEPPAVGRFPGDRREYPPVIPPADDPNPTGEPNQPPKTVDQLVADAALPEFPTNRPAKGFVFFHYRGRTKSIHSLELVYDDGAGRKATIPIF